MRTRATTAALPAAITAALLAAAPAAAGSPFDVTVHAGLESVRPGEELPVAVVFAIAAKHKVYDDAASALEVGLAPGKGAKLLGSVKRPLPHEKFDSATGKPRRVHEGRVVFRFAVEAPGPLTGEPGKVLVKVRVRFEGCSESICFLPDVECQMRPFYSACP